MNRIAATATARPDSARRRRRSLRRDDNGGVTVEFVIWFPIILGIAALSVDLSLIFTTNAHMYDAARDAARRMALHQSTAAEAEARVLTSMMFGSASDYAVEAVDGSDVSVTITTPVAAASVFGAYAALLPGDLRARVVMMKEPR